MPSLPATAWRPSSGTAARVRPVAAQRGDVPHDGEGRSRAERDVCARRQQQARRCRRPARCEAAAAAVCPSRRDRRRPRGLRRARSSLRSWCPRSSRRRAPTRRRRDALSSAASARRPRANGPGSLNTSDASGASPSHVSANDDARKSRRGDASPGIVRAAMRRTGQAHVGHLARKSSRGPVDGGLGRGQRKVDRHAESISRASHVKKKRESNGVQGLDEGRRRLFIVLLLRLSLGGISRHLSTISSTVA